jgi:hypothetical protein
MWKDALGRDIKVGDYVCYSAMLSQSCKMKFGKVTELKSRPNRWTHVDERPELPTLRVKTALDSHYWEKGTYKFHEGAWHLQADGKPITIDKLENVVVLRREDMPQAALELLDG